MIHILFYFKKAAFRDALPGRKPACGPATGQARWDAGWGGRAVSVVVAVVVVVWLRLFLFMGSVLVYRDGSHQQPPKK